MRATERAARDQLLIDAGRSVSEHQRCCNVAIPIAHFAMEEQAFRSTVIRTAASWAERSLMTDIGYWLSGLIALGIVIVGTRSFLAPRAAAAAFGVPVPPDARWEAYLSVKAVRDIASGLLTAIVILNRSAHLLGWFMLVAMIIPLTDAAIVLKYGGTKTSAFGIHGATAGVMLIISGILLLG